MTAEQMIELTQAVQRTGISAERLQQVFASGILDDVFDPNADPADRSAVRKALKLGPLNGNGRPARPSTNGAIFLEVDYGSSLEQMTVAGHYDWRNEDISPKEFPLNGTGCVEYEARLFVFERGVSSEDAEKAIRDADPVNPWEPAKIEHLLAFGAKYPDAQREHPIIALGSVSANKVFGHRNVPYLYRRVTGRSLHLDWWGNGWHPFYRFLAVRKI